MNYPALPAIYDRLKQLVAIADEMRVDGVAVDADRVAWLLEGARPGYQAMQQELVQLGEGYRLAGFNPGSTKHLAKLFFGKLGLNPIETTKKGAPKIDKGVLISLLAYGKEVQQIASRVLEYRQLGKLISTYLENIEKNDNGLVHVNWLPQRAKTGRWASKPNHQNLPAPMRCIFVPRKPENYFVGADASSLEARIVAGYAGATTLLKWWAQDVNYDIHTETARIFMKDPTITKKHPRRDDLKNVFYLSLYVGGVPRLVSTLALKRVFLTEQQARVMKEAIFRVHPEIPAWHKDMIRFVAKHDYVEECVHGRRTFFHGRPDPSRCTNFMGQATAAAIINNAVLAIHAELRDDEYMVSQVHDQIVLEGPDPVRLKNLLEKHMQREYVIGGHVMQFPCEAKIGRSLSEVK